MEVAVQALRFKKPLFSCRNTGHLLGALCGSRTTLRYYVLRRSGILRFYYSVLPVLVGYIWNMRLFISPSKSESSHVAEASYDYA